MSETPQVLLRLDASPEIGLGHAARCLALAHELRARDASVSVLAHELTEQFNDFFSELGCDVIRLVSRDDPDEVVTRISHVRGSNHSVVLLVDQYALDAAWEAEVRRAVSRLVVLEDRPFRRHDADILVDPGADERRVGRYEALVPERAQIVTGRDFVLIHPRYVELRSVVPARDGPVQRVLVQLGSDRSDLVLRVLSALESVASSSIQVHVVLSSDHPHLAGAKRLCGVRGWGIHSDVRDIWHLYTEVDLAIAAPGVSVWERMCLGVPSAVIGTTEMHRDGYMDLQESGAITWLGQSTELESDELATSLRRTVERTDLRRSSEACREAVDGRGASRLASLLTIDATSEVALRPATVDDEERILRWANDRDTRRWSFTQEPITAAEPREWFSSRLSDRCDCRMHLLVDHWQVELGVVRLERDSEGAWQMSATLAPGYRNRGLAESLVRLACDRHLHEFGPDVTIEASVRLNRPGAGHVLSRVGLVRVAEDANGTFATYRRTFGASPPAAPWVS